MLAPARFFSLLLGCVLFAAPLASGQDYPATITLTLVELLANPEKFDAKMVTTYGFLVIGHEPKHGVEVGLYLHQEDAQNLLANEILVMPRKQMLLDEEKINHRYVI